MSGTTPEVEASWKDAASVVYLIFALLSFLASGVVPIIYPAAKGTDLLLAAIFMILMALYYRR